MKCQNCGGTGYFATNCYADIEECSTCDGTGVVEPLTNEEWLKQANTEQLAEWLSNTFDLCGAGCSKCFVKELCFDEHNNKMPSDLVVEWLKQQHSEVEK